MSKYRHPAWSLYLQVRAAGFSLLASMCGGREVGERLVGQWTPHEKLGPWGALMGVAVDRSEAELVRQQVGPSN